MSAPNNGINEESCLSTSFNCYTLAFSNLSAQMIAYAIAFFKPILQTSLLCLLVHPILTSADSHIIPQPTAPPFVCGVGKCTVTPVSQRSNVSGMASKDAQQLIVQSVNYTAFNGSNYVMKEFVGKNTSVLITESDLQIFTAAQARELVDQADYLYETFKDLMDVEPIGSGPLRIAFVQTCGAGCGYVGYKGVEIGPTFANGTDWSSLGDLASLQGVLHHEMTHNFDRWSSYVAVGTDLAHVWTGFMDAYVRYYNRQGQLRSPTAAEFAPDEFMDRRISDFFSPYAKQVGASWQICIRDGACTNMNRTDVQGGFIIRLAKLIGPEATRIAMQELKTAATTRGLNPSTMTPEQKNDLLIECFSRGARTNLTCVIDALNWTISASLQTQLASLFGTTNRACLDEDADTFTPLAGDLEDANPNRHPQATELVNGIDDDCNGIVDDVLSTETSDFPGSPGVALPFPFRVIGRTSSNTDDDFFKITLPATTLVRFTLTSRDSFAGWIFVYNSGGGWFDFRHCGVGSESTLDLSLSAGEWRFSVSPNSASAPGGYQLTARPYVYWPAHLYPGQPTMIGSNLWRLVSPLLITNLSGSTNLQARYWASSFGWIGTNAMGSSNRNSFNWFTTSNLAPREISYRVQFWSGNIPIDRATEALPLAGGIPFGIELVSNMTLLSWSAASPGLFVYSAPTLAGPWLQQTNVPQFTNGQYRTLSTYRDASKFYRLQGN